MMSEKELLQAFTDDRSEDAFAQLVRRYAGLVYSTARRRLANTSLAEDITQIVFIRFAKNPPRLKNPAALAAWLHRTTVHATIDLWRSETRRRAREMEAVVMEPATPETNLWDEISPKLDEALDQLNEDDRQALLLRFFNQKSMREVGVTLGVSEDAAKMRVSRALDRLRTQMGTSVAACTAVVLGTLLTEHSAEAAPAQLLARLSAIKLPAAAGLGGLAGMLWQMSKFKWAVGAAVVAVLALSVIYFTHLPSAATTMSGTSPTNSVADQMANTGTHSINLAPAGSPVAPAPVEAPTLFHITDSETGQPLAHSQIHVAYFGIGGDGNSHDFVTDENGTATLPGPDATHGEGGNVFVVAEGHVPVAIMFHSMPTNYSLKLDPAMTASGIIEDEQGRPVSGVKIWVQTPGNISGQSVNVDFQTCPVTNHEDGTWSCSYIPFDYTNELRLLLRKKGYAATYPIIPVDRTGLTNLVLIINRGYTIQGQVIGAQDAPVAHARIKVVTDEPGKEQSTETDDNGFYTLDGVAGAAVADYKFPPLEKNDNGAFVIRGMAGNGLLHVDLEIQAKGFAPQTTAVALSSVTNNADFTLSLGNIFRGHVVDEAGHPISNAIVQTDWNNQGIRVFDWHTLTDGGGGFEWDFAPQGSGLYWIEAKGYAVQRDVSLVADGSDHQIVLQSISSQ